MGRARDARVITPNELLEPSRRLVMRQVEDRWREPGQVRLDGCLVLGGGGHDLAARTMPASSTS